MSEKKHFNITFIHLLFQQCFANLWLWGDEINFNLLFFFPKYNFLSPFYAVHFAIHTQNPFPALPWCPWSSPAQWQWWMQNMEHINAADSGQCQAFLHCVKLNKQDQAKANGNWPSRDKAVATEARGHRNLKPSSNLCGLSEKKKRNIFSTHWPDVHTFIHCCRVLTGELLWEESLHYILSLHNASSEIDCHVISGFYL